MDEGGFSNPTPGLHISKGKLIKDSDIWFLVTGSQPTTVSYPKLYESAFYIPNH